MFLIKQLFYHMGIHFVKYFFKISLHTVIQTFTFPVILITFFRPLVPDSDLKKTFSTL